MNKELLVICRGGGDLATGIVCRLKRAGYRVLILETEKPAAIRRQVAFSDAVYEGKGTVEDVTAVRIEDTDHLEDVFEAGQIPVLVDSEAACIGRLHPDIVVDAILAKKNLGTTIEMAPLVIGVGPGFTAGKDVHYVIESQRGHNLGRIISEGCAAANTGVPGNIGGFTRERVIHSAGSGILENLSAIGDVVEKGQVIAVIHGEEDILVTATISGILRGLIRDGYAVTKGFKIADIDPRKEEMENCFTISDKARNIGGSVLELAAAYANGVLNG